MQKLASTQKLALFLMAYVIMIFALVYLEVKPEVLVHIVYVTIATVMIGGGFYALFGQKANQQFLLEKIHSFGDSVTGKELLEPYKEEFVRQFLYICALWRLEDHGFVEQRNNQYTLTPKGLTQLECLEMEASIR